MTNWLNTVNNESWGTIENENNREGTIRFPNWANNREIPRRENNRKPTHWCPRSGQVMGNNQVTRKIM